MKQFKIRAHAVSKIMGRIGLTDSQESYLMELHTRKYDPNAKPLTKKMEQDLSELIHKRDNAKLPDTAVSYLQEWYSGEEKQLRSKEIEKGLMCENECIQFMAHVLELGIAEKNRERFEDEYKSGEPDVLITDAVIDVKSPFDRRTLQAKCTGMENDYWWQGLTYCLLTKRNRFIIFYGLMDTDESVNYGEEVIYSDLPDNERWIAYEVTFTDAQLAEYDKQINDRVMLCRDWLNKYDAEVKSKMGRINKY